RRVAGEEAGLSFRLNLRVPARFALGVAAAGPVILDAAAALSQRHHHENAPQAIPILDGEMAFPLPIEKAAENRLEQVLGIDLGTHRRVQLLASQADNPAGETIKYFSCCRIVAGAELSDEATKGVRRRHAILAGRERAKPFPDYGPRGMEN